MAFLIAAGMAVVLTPLLGRLGSAVGLVDRPGELKIHRSPVPLTGGIAAVVAAVAAMWWAGALPRWPALAGVALALVIGIADDARPLPPWARVLLLGGAGALLVGGGVELEPFGPLAAAGTVLLVLACANGLNITDGQDGLAGGVGAVAALGLGAVGVVAGLAEAAPALAVAGGLAGFLLWNFPRARVFLGDGGAYAVGTLLALLAATSAVDWPALLGAATVLLLLVFELTFTVARRLLHRQSLSGGDRLHSYDLLSQRLGRTWATVCLWGAAAVMAGAGTWVATMPTFPAALCTAGLAALATLAGLVLWARREVRHPYQDSYDGDRMPAQGDGPTLEP